MGKEERRGEGGGRVEDPSALAIGPGAHNMFGQEEASVLKTPSERKRNVNGGKRALSPSSSIDAETRVAETRKTSRTKNALLPCSLDRFVLYVRSKTGSLFRFL